MKMHKFLLDQNSNLTMAAESLPMVHNHLESLPKTKATFTLSDTGVPQCKMYPIHLEFCKSWEVPGFYTAYQVNRYVNPDYAHASMYTDMAERCDCGALVTRTDKSHIGLHRENDHEDDCPLYRKCEVRADILRRSYFMITRLMMLGWRAPDIGKRFGVGKKAIIRQIERRGVSHKELRDEYRRVTANTFCYLIREKGHSNQKIADIYGMKKRAIESWASKYADHDPDERQVEFTPDNGFSWEKKPGYEPLSYSEMNGVLV